MLTEERLLPIFDNIDPNLKTVSVLKRTLVKKDGVVISSHDQRCSFYPGQIEEVKSHCEVEDSAEIQYLNSIWTPEVIANYDALVNPAELKALL